MSRPADSLLECRDLTVSIGEVRVVDGLDLDLRPGQFWGLLGPNGIGKTTLLRCLAGLRDPDSGQVCLTGEKLDALPRRLVARHLGMLQQHTAYVFDASVQQTALTGRHPHLSYWEREGPGDLQRTQSALRELELDHLTDRSVTGLSGGEARRLAFATLLVQDTEVMLLDEPTNHLDLSHQVGIMAMIEKGVANGKTALAAIHDVNLAARYCTHLLLLLGSGRWEAGPAAEKLDTDILQRLFGCTIERLDGPSGPRFHPVSG